MKLIELDELKKIQLEILSSVHEFCVSKNIHYSLAYGTLIGAIRHKGYIPWDDDIDIMMPRDDYERFLDTFNGTYCNLDVLSPNDNKYFYAPYANVIRTDTVLIENRKAKKGCSGIKIDVFPIDSVPNDKSDRVKMYQRVHTYQLYIGLKNTVLSYQTTLLSKMAGLFMHVVGKFLPLGAMLNNFALKSNEKNANSDWVNNIVWCTAGEKASFRKTDIAEYVDVSFEGFEFKALSGYEYFLKAHYGDYMQLPPVEQRQPKHDFMAYWK